MPRHLTILGTGLIGTSVALAAKASGAAEHIVGYGGDSSHLQIALQRGAIDVVAASLSEALDGSDLVMLCAPLQANLKLIDAITELNATASISDVGSTKQTICRHAHAKLGDRFIGGHPMAGSEQSGPETARADLFQNAAVLLTPNEPRPSGSDSTVSPSIRSTLRVESLPDGRGSLQTLRDFWTTLGGRVLVMSPADHDARVALASHLPHVVAAALTLVQTPESRQVTAGGYRDCTRIAGANPELWSGILSDNRDAVRTAIAAMRERLDEIDRSLESGELLEILGRARHLKVPS